MALNAFRILGDWSHVVAVMMLLHRLLVIRNSQGVSRKTQELLLLVYVCRYIDVFTAFYSLYNTFMKYSYIFSTMLAVVAMTPTFKFKASETYRKEHDGFPHWKYIALPCVLIPVVTHMSGDLTEMLWAYSIYLESVALIPQIVLFRRYRQVENLTGLTFILLSGLYRGLYIFNWICRANTELLYRHHWEVYTSGIVMVLVCFGGVFWPQAESAAPLWPQLRQLCTCNWKAALCLVLATICYDNLVDSSSSYNRQPDSYWEIYLGVGMVSFICFVRQYNKSSSSSSSVQANALEEPLLLIEENVDSSTDPDDHNTTPNIQII